MGVCSCSSRGRRLGLFVQFAKTTKQSHFEPEAERLLHAYLGWHAIETFCDRGRTSWEFVRAVREDGGWVCSCNLRKLRNNPILSQKRSGCYMRTWVGMRLKLSVTVGALHGSLFVQFARTAVGFVRAICENYETIPF